MSTPCGRARRESRTAGLVAVGCLLGVVTWISGLGLADAFADATEPVPTDPSASASPSPTADPSPSPSPSDSPSPTDSPSPSPTATAGPAGPSDLPPRVEDPLPLTLGLISIDDVESATIARPGAAPRYLDPGEPLAGLRAYDKFRMRFLVTSRSDAETTWTPQLQYRLVGETEFRDVPEQAAPGAAFNLTREWVSLPGGGTRVADDDVAVTPDQMRMCSDAASVGHRTQVANPDTASLVRPTTCTEQEFSLGVAMDARSGASYEFRLTDAGVEIPAAATGSVSVGAAPAGSLSPGQRHGHQVPGPVRSASRQRALARSAGPARVTTVSATAATATAPDQPAAGIHGPFSMTSGECAVCHRAHGGSSQNLLVTTGSTAGLCFTCHSAGIGATTDIEADYGLARPADDPATRSYYSHDAVGAGSHALASEDEFAGVLNRHNECTDCHSAHQARSGPATVQLTGPGGAATGWSAPGALGGISGVSVSNGPANSTPSYTFLDGIAQPLTHEYQLCLKCHSGHTVLPPDRAGQPSTDFLDAGVEFNPNNASFHPVEGVGTNHSAAMAESLSGTSPYKLWEFTVNDTVRCVNCHASSDEPDGVAADAALSTHTSANRGLLIRPYEDRRLLDASAAYQPSSFALCLTCHGEAPLIDTTPNTGTNFEFHGLHVTGLAGLGAGGLDIDQAGAGQGNALCAECHFRSHSTSYAVGDQQIDGSRLVNFAPDVEPYRGVLSFSSNPGGGGSCTLTCHGYPHDGVGYGG